MARAKSKRQVLGRTSCERCVNWPKVSERVRVGRLMSAAIKKMEEKVKAEGFNVTVAEFLKLVQLEKDLYSEDLKEIKVTWVEPEKKKELHSEG